MSVVDPIRDERGWAFTRRRATSDPVNGFDVPERGLRATDPTSTAASRVPVLWDTRDRPHRQQRVRRHPADARRRPSATFADAPRRPLSRARTAREIDALNDRDLRQRQQRRLQGRLRHAARTVYEGEVHGAVRDARRARRSAWPTRRYLFGDAAGGDRLAPVHHAAALRRRLLHPLQVQPAPARRLREPLAVPARPLPAAGHRRDGRLRPDPRALLPHAPDDQPDGLVAVRPDADFDAPHGRG